MHIDKQNTKMLNLLLQRRLKMYLFSIRAAIHFIFYILGAYATTDILRLTRCGSAPVSAPDCYCPKCGQKLRLRDQLPIFSYFWNKGRCRSCHSPIPFSDLFLELFLFVSMSAAAILTHYTWFGFFSCLLLYELTKLLFILIAGKRELDFSKNLLRSLLNNLFLFGITALVFAFHYLVLAAPNG